MKRLTLKYNWLYFIALCASLLTACEPTQVSIDKDAIAFKNAPASPTAFEGNGNARLFAYTTTSTDATPSWVYGSASQGAPANLTNVDFEKRTATFAVKGETKYWADATYNFFSVYSETLADAAPSFVPIFNTETKKFTFTYDVIADQQNELWAALLLDEPTHIATNEKVDLEFNHILSKINFNVKKSTANDSNTIKVDTISLTGFYGRGKFELDVASKAMNWIPEGENEKFSYSYIPTGGGIDITTDGTKVLATARNNKGGLLAIPQAVSARTVKVTIKYDFYNKNNVDFGPRTAEAYLPINTVNRWEIGKNYTYNLILKAESNDILFSTPTIEDWDRAQVGGTIIIQ